MPYTLSKMWTGNTIWNHAPAGWICVRDDLMSEKEVYAALLQLYEETRRDPRVSVQVTDENNGTVYMGALSRILPAVKSRVCE